MTLPYNTQDSYNKYTTFPNIPYNLNNDPHELNNLIDKDKRTAYELEQKLFVWLTSMGYGEDYPRQILKQVLKIKEY